MDLRRARRIVLSATVSALALLSGAAAFAAGNAWDGYLDYAYVYSSADSAALKARIAQYGKEAGVPLDRYITEQFETTVDSDEPGPDDELRIRRQAIGYLLLYLASSDADQLEKSVDAIDQLSEQLGRSENHYWYHYIHAHEALELGREHDFVGYVLDLWQKVVVPLEEPYQTMQALSLNDSPAAGFAAALPYLYENVARLILLRSQELGVDSGLDPLGSVIRMLADGRVGGHPDVIPVSASSKEYLTRIIERLDGAESDAGSLTFTLALFEAAKLHDTARSKLASEGLGEATVKALQVASASYQTALDRADTVQGEAAVHTRTLRLLGEIYAAKQRLGVDPEIQTTFTLEDAIDVYTRMADAGDDGWGALGYLQKPDYVLAMRGLWEEIQEASLNIADYYLAQSQALPHKADEHARNAARLYTRYLQLFLYYATNEGKEGVPDSAYFAAHEAARGIGDAYLIYAKHPTSEEIDVAIRQYRAALKIFPFDRQIWPGITAALQRQGRESEYLELVRPAAEGATRSRALTRWIASNEPEAERLKTLVSAFSDSLVLVYLGYAEGKGIDELEAGLSKLSVQRDEAKTRLKSLQAQLAGGSHTAPPAAMSDEGELAGPLGTGEKLDAAQLSQLNKDIDEASALVERLSTQIEARRRTLPLYKSTLETDGLSDELRSRRDHPLHALLRRMYHEHADVDVTEAAY
ncbi:MAG: hypothetical protein ACHQ6V_17255 [Myxococcota bacterium]|jgi:hypothetical protein